MIRQKTFYHNQPTTSLTTLFTATALTNVSFVSLVNTTASPATITLYFVPPSRSADATTAYIPLAYSVGPKDKISIREEYTLEIGGTIQALQGTASAVTLILMGFEVS